MVEELGDGGIVAGVHELGHRGVVHGRTIEELGHCHIVRLLIQELGHSHVIFGLIEELSHRSVVSSVHELGHGCVIARTIEELSHGNVIALLLKLLAKIEVYIKLSFNLPWYLEFAFSINTKAIFLFIFLLQEL